MPCVSKGVSETCTDAYGCDDWFKKRATKVDANTAVIDRYTSTGTYFQCATGQPIYKEHRDYQFNNQDYKSYLEPGTNTVTGQAFLTQNGGGVVTCAGQYVVMYPDSDYFNQRDADIAKGCHLNNESNDVSTLFKTSQCDAQGNFDFNKVPAGNYIISVNVSWNVSSVKSIGNYVYTDNQMQGGPLRKKVIIKDGEVNKFIITK